MWNLPITFLPNVQVENLLEQIEALELFIFGNILFMADFLIIQIDCINVIDIINIRACSKVMKSKNSKLIVIHSCKNVADFKAQVKLLDEVDILNNNKNSIQTGLMLHIWLSTPKLTNSQIDLIKNL